MQQVLAIAAGGALGAVLRFWMQTGAQGLFGRDFPYGTLAVNVLGSFGLGFLAIWLVAHWQASDELRLALTVGLLGSFTTFSTFSMETLTLIQQGAAVRAGLNIGLNVTLCLAAAWLGLLLAQKI